MISPVKAPRHRGIWRALRRSAILLVSVAPGVTGQVLSPQPLLKIGEGLGAETFGRIAGVVQLPSGGIAVADGSNQVVVLFNSAGHRIGTAGRPGSGPGEFRLIQSIRHCWGDSLVVYDPALLRVSVFGPTGGLGGTMDLARSQAGQRPYDLWCGDGGTVVLLNRALEGAPPPGIGPYRPGAILVAARPNGVLVPLDTILASERYFSGHEDFLRPLGRRTSVATAGTTAFVIQDELSSDSLGVGIYNLNARRPVGHLRVPVRHKPTRDGEVDRYIDDQVERGPVRDASSRRAFLRTLQYPDFLPASIRILTDPAGQLWIEAHALLDAPARHWSIFTRRGVHVADLQVPGEFEITAIGQDRVAGIWRARDGAESVRVYRHSTTTTHRR